MKSNLRLMGPVVIAVNCGLLVLFFLSFNARVGAVHGRNAREAVVHLQNRFLKATVENQIDRIETCRMEERARWNRRADQAAAALSACSDLDEERALAIFQGLFHGDLWTTVLREAETGRVLFRAGAFSADSFGAEGEGDEEVFAVGRRQRFGPYEAFFGVTAEALDGRVQAFIADEIHRSTFPFGSYLWVNEVLDYGGGDGYAVRRIHPNLPETEGMLLSTSMEDVRGNLPYLAELEGVREKDELFFSYFFKKKNSDTISEKLAYAKLYRPYNWIVAFGIHLDDMEAFTKQTTEESRRVAARLGLVFLFLLVSLLVLSQVLLLLGERWFHRKDRRLLEAEVNEDALTGACSRRAAERDLAGEFEAFRRGAGAPAVMLFDVDRFKEVNDTYGHDGGDIVLRGIVETLRGTLRQTDSVYRWGGDEFLLLCRGLRPENAPSLARELLRSLAAVRRPVGGASLSVAVSMGIACFRADDDSFADAVRRADEGLYRAKKEGGNRAFVIHDDLAESS